MVIGRSPWDGSGRCADDELDVELDGLRGVVVQQEPDGLGALAQVRLLDGGEGRRDERRLGHVVEADDREPVGDGEAALCGRVEHAEREHVGEGDDRRRAVGAVEQPGDGAAAGCSRPPSSALANGTDVQSMPGGLEPGAPAREAGGADVAVHEPLRLSPPSSAPLG